MKAYTHFQELWLAGSYRRTKRSPKPPGRTRTSVPRTFRVGVGGWLLAEELAEIDEVRLGGGTLFETGGPPLAYELLRRHDELPILSSLALT